MMLCKFRASLERPFAALALAAGLLVTGAACKINKSGLSGQVGEAGGSKTPAGLDGGSFGGMGGTSTLMPGTGGLLFPSGGGGRLRLRKPAPSSNSEALADSLYRMRHLEIATLRCLQPVASPGLIQSMAPMWVVAA